MDVNSYLNKIEKIKYWREVSILVIIIFSLIIRLKNISAPLLDVHSFRQAQTATVARNFYLDGIDVLHTRLDILGLGREQILLLEFPFYQAMVAFLAYFIGFSDSLGRAISIFFGISAGLVLMFLVNDLTQNRLLGLGALTFFLFAPLNIFFQQAFMIESTVVALHIFSVYSWWHYAKKKKMIWLIVAVFLTTLAFLQKSIYAPFLSLSILGLMSLTAAKRKYLDKRGIIGLLIAIVILVIWQYYVDYTNRIHGNSFFTLGSREQYLWNFGLVSERFSLNIWKIRLLSIMNSLTKLFILVFIIGVWRIISNKIKANIFILIWLLSMTVYYLFFFRIQSHEYYFMIVIPVASIVASYGLFYLAKSISLFLLKTKQTQQRILIAFIFIYLVVFGLKGWQNSLPLFSLNSSIKQELAIINKSLKDDGYVIFVFPEYDWNSVYTYYTKRKGIALGVKSVNKEQLENFKNQGYKYLVLFNKNILEVAGQNSGIKTDLLSLVYEERNIKIYKLI